MDLDLQEHFCALLNEFRFERAADQKVTERRWFSGRNYLQRDQILTFSLHRFLKTSTGFIFRFFLNL